jgi:hypothetical protein
MTPENFAFWLNGFAELTGEATPTPEQWKSICEHLATVFNKVTPPVKSPSEFLRTGELPPANPGESTQSIFEKYIRDVPGDPYPFAPKCSVGGTINGKPTAFC